MNSLIKLSSPATHEYWEIPVLFQDEHLLALDKPAGLLTTPEAGDPERSSLLNLLHQAIKEQKPWVGAMGLTFLSNANSLDPEVSGIVLLARSKPVLASLANALGNEKPAFEFLALVQGTPEEREFEISASLAPHPTRPGIVCVAPKRGKRSRTLLILKESFGRWSWLCCRPLTLRTHQIRAHLRYAGFPVVAAHSYGGKPLFLSEFKPGYRLKPGHTEQPLLRRPALHASKLSLPHPVLGEPLELVAPLPKDLQVALKYLRKFSAPDPKQELPQ